MSQKIKKLERVDFKKEFSVRYDELDVNQHVNNANYIAFALEPLDFEFRKTCEPVYKQGKLIEEINGNPTIKIVYRLVGCYFKKLFFVFYESFSINNN